MKSWRHITEDQEWELYHQHEPMVCMLCRKDIAGPRPYCPRCHDAQDQLSKPMLYVLTQLRNRISKLETSSRFSDEGIIKQIKAEVEEGKNWCGDCYKRRSKCKCPKHHPIVQK